MIRGPHEFPERLLFFDFALVVVACAVVVFGELDLLCSFSGHSPDRNRPGRDGVQQVPFFRGRHRGAHDQLLDDDENLFQSRSQQPARQRFTTQNGVLELPVISLCRGFAETLRRNIAKERTDNLRGAIAFIGPWYLSRLIQLAPQALCSPSELRSSRPKLPAQRALSVSCGHKSVERATFHANNVNNPAFNTNDPLTKSLLAPVQEFLRNLRNNS